MTLEGNLGSDPEVRFLASGVAVANFRIATGERKLNRETNQWEDGRQCWVSVTCWRQIAENVGESLHRGDKVIVVGRLYEETYTPQGSDQPRTVMKLDADMVGPSLANATAQVRRAERQQGGQQQGGFVPGQGQPANDPWATAPQGQQQQPAQGWQQQPQQGQQPGWGSTPPGQGQQPWGQQPPAGDGPPF